MILPNEIDTIIRNKLAESDMPRRVALSTRFPALSGGILFVKRTARSLSNIFNTRLIQSTSLEYYQNIVCRHQSILFRRLGDSDPRMQKQKVTNLKLAVQKLNGILIPPGKTFSFWHIVGKPTYRSGYVDGMLLANGKVVEGIGGGLCQLSNLIYWLFLHTPLTITERHRHTFDVFPDSGRVLPFGSGATIMFNIIDLRAHNSTDSTLQLKLWVTDKHLKGQVLSSKPFERKYHIYEKYHCFVNHIGKYYRFNEIWRHELIRGRILQDEKITENFAPVMYDVDEDKLHQNGYQVLNLT